MPAALRMALRQPPRTPFSLLRASINSFDLLQGLRQGMAVIRVAVERLSSDEPTAAAGDRHTDFAAELVTFMGFAFADAFHGRFVNTVGIETVHPDVDICGPGHAESAPDKSLACRYTGRHVFILHTIRVFYQVNLICFELFNSDFPPFLSRSCAKVSSE